MISVITPVRNGARHIRACLRSVQRGDFTDYEHIVVDDASTDGTAAIVAKMAARDPRIRLLRLSTSIGADRARYHGVKQAQGDFLAFLDADDRFAPLALSSMSAAMTPDVDIVQMGISLRLPHLPLTKRYSSGLKENLTGTAALTSLLDGTGLTSSMCDKLYRTSQVREYWRPTGLKVGEDWLMNIMVMPHVRQVAGTSYIGYLWRFSGLGTKYYLQRWEEYLQALHMAQTELSAEFHPPLAGSYLRTLREAVIQRIMARSTDMALVNFIQSGLNEPILGERRPDVNMFLDECRQFLLNHKKYYTFTRILAKI